MLSLQKEGRTRDSRDESLHAMLHCGIAALCGFLIFNISANAQTVPPGTAHSASLSWTAPSPVGGSGTIAGYNLYKSIGTGAYIKVNASPLTVLTYTDSAVTSGQALNYCATTVDSKNQESVCSTVVPVTIPVNPNPPTLTITSVAIIINGNSQTVVAKWADTLPVGQYFAFTDGTNFLNQGLTSSATGTFAEEVTVPMGTPVTFLACDTAGTCASQVVAQKAL